MDFLFVVHYFICWFRYGNNPENTYCQALLAKVSESSSYIKHYIGPLVHT